MVATVIFEQKFKRVACLRATDLSYPCFVINEEFNVFFQAVISIQHK